MTKGGVADAWVEAAGLASAHAVRNERGSSDDAVAPLYNVSAERGDEWNHSLALAMLASKVRHDETTSEDERLAALAIFSAHQYGLARLEGSLEGMERGVDAMDFVAQRISAMEGWSNRARVAFFNFALAQCELACFRLDERDAAAALRALWAAGARLRETAVPADGLVECSGNVGLATLGVARLLKNADLLKNAVERLEEAASAAQSVKLSQETRWALTYQATPHSSSGLGTLHRLMT